MAEDLSDDAKEFLLLMEAAEWSPSETAKRIGCSPSAISELKAGNMNPARLVSVLRLTIAIVKPEVLRKVYSAKELTGLGLKDATEAVPSWARELLADFDCLHEQERTAAVEAIRKLLELVPKKVSHRKNSAA